MKMITRPLVFAVSMVAALALSACNKTDESASAPGTPPPAMSATPPAATPPPMMTPAPAGDASAAVSVTSVDLGSSVDASNHIAAAGNSFAPKDSIYAAVMTSGRGSAKLDARWTYQDGQVVHEDSKTVDASGEQATTFMISNPTGFPVGSYKLEISLNGNMVSSKDFAVK